MILDNFVRMTGGGTKKIDLLFDCKGMGLLYAKGNNTRHNPDDFVK